MAIHQAPPARTPPPTLPFPFFFSTSICNRTCLLFYTFFKFPPPKPPIFLPLRSVPQQLSVLSPTKAYASVFFPLKFLLIAFCRVSCFFSVSTYSSISLAGDVKVPFLYFFPQRSDPVTPRRRPPLLLDLKGVSFCLRSSVGESEPPPRPVLCLTGGYFVSWPVVRLRRIAPSTESPGRELFIFGLFHPISPRFFRDMIFRFSLRLCPIFLPPYNSKESSFHLWGRFLDPYAVASGETLLVRISLFPPPTLPLCSIARSFVCSFVQVDFILSTLIACSLFFPLEFSRPSFSLLSGLQ